MNLTSFLQDKKLTIILKGEIDHHMAKETMKLIGEKIDSYLPMICILDYKNVVLWIPAALQSFFLHCEKCGAGRRTQTAELTLQCRKSNSHCRIQKLIKISERTESYEGE